MKKQFLSLTLLLSVVASSQAGFFSWFSSTPTSCTCEVAGPVIEEVRTPVIEEVITPIIPVKEVVTEVAKSSFASKTKDAFGSAWSNTKYVFCNPKAVASVVYNKTKTGLGTAKDVVVAHPYMTTGIVVGSLAAVYGVKKFMDYRKAQAEKVRIAAEQEAARKTVAPVVFDRDAAITAAKSYRTSNHWTLGTIQNDGQHAIITDAQAVLAISLPSFDGASQEQLSVLCEIAAKSAILYSDAYNMANSLKEAQINRLVARLS